MRRKLIAGNWKMNMLKEEGLSLARSVFDKVNGQNFPFDVLICPPMSLVGLVAGESTQGVFVGVQDVSIAPKDFGAFTGDVSAKMVKDLGATHAIVGHSERRAQRSETDLVVREKAVNAINNGLVAIICVGETLEERDSGSAIEVVCHQIRESVPSIATAQNCVIAYEPVWAIGTGKVPTIHDVAEMHAAIRKELASQLGQDVAQEMRVLYGGSVKPTNARELLAVDNVDGALIGGASLKIEDFWGIAESQI